MTRDDERLLRLKQQRSKEAIDLAMQARWQEAVDINKEIIESFPEDVDACNRLGRAYMELGQYALAREAYSRTVQQDPYNAIAARNLRRLSDLGESDSAEVETDKVEPHHFIEEIGKAGVVTLYELEPKENRARMVAGDKVQLKVEGSVLSVENSRGVYMGKVEPKYAQRLIRLMLGGNQYTASVIKSTMDLMTVIIRETYQHPSQVGKLSFPPKGLEEFRSYVSDKLLKVDEEEDESGYTIIGGDEIEVLPEESEGVDDADSDDE
ncbi:MAG: tetratricopeptide repeat protein [Dehalococcoidales bacterium]|nr:tetratricopeptide repeat protein [Dehalococcoidales bacterium]